MASAAARQAAIATGASPADVDAFIAREGGDRVSDQRVMSAFGASSGGKPVPGTGTPTAPTSTTSPVGLATGSDPGTGGGGGGGGVGTGAPIVDPGTPALAGITAAVSDSGGGGSLGGSSVTSMDSAALRSGLGKRILPQGSMALAGLQKAAY